MTDIEKNLRTMLAEQYNTLAQHSSIAAVLAAGIARPCSCADDEPGGDCTCRSDDEYRADAAIHAQLALAASNAVQSLAVLIAREPV